MRAIAFLPEARDEFLSHVRHYEGEREGLGQRFTSAVMAAAELALAYPRAGSPFLSGTRRVIVRGFPFSLAYRDTDAGILIIALPHHSREPGYWRKR